jgi:hypothetical protein
MRVGFVKEKGDDAQLFAMEPCVVKEVVLTGDQVDDCSRYWNRKEMIENPFVYADGRY